jgi:hypothetical protein
MQRALCGRVSGGETNPPRWMLALQNESGPGLRTLLAHDVVDGTFAFGFWFVVIRQRALVEDCARTGFA